MNVVWNAFGYSTNLVHLFVTIVTFIRRANHFDSHLRLCQPRPFTNQSRQCETDLAFCCVLDPGALPDVSETTMCEVVVTISSDLPSEVRQSGEEMGERDTR
jgi:hypothetical protein